MNPSEPRPQKPTTIPINALRLRQARQQAQLTIEEAARQTTINKMTLQRYESGDIRTISPERLERLADAYGTSQAWLIGISPQQEFLTADGLLLSPRSADEPTRLGKRLLACLDLRSHAETSPSLFDLLSTDLPSSHTPGDHTH